MLDTFRKRDNPRDNVRAPGSASPAMRPPQPGPQVRINETKIDAPPQVDPAIARPAPLDLPPAAKPEPSPVQSMAPAHSGGTARLIVGAEIKLKGAEISDCDTLIVEGDVDASMTSRVIEVAQTGLFRGKVQVDFAEVRGRFEGELTAHKQLMIRSSGRVSGKIRYGSILVEEGGELSGDVAVAEGGSSARARAPAASDAAGDAPALREPALAASSRQAPGTVAPPR